VNTVHGKKSVFVRDVVIHHYKSQSTVELSDRNRKEFITIINEDKKAFAKIRDEWERQKNT
jgi:hypothetical protein